MTWCSFDPVDGHFPETLLGRKKKMCLDEEILTGGLKSTACLSLRRIAQNVERRSIVCMCQIYIHTYIHTYIPTYIHTYIHTYVHTYIHTYLHAYLHIYMCLLSSTPSIPIVQHCARRFKSKMEFWIVSSKWQPENIVFTYVHRWMVLWWMRSQRRCGPHGAWRGSLLACPRSLPAWCGVTSQ